MKEICPIEQCTGCSACLNACAKSAITMHFDKLGFMYPSINQSLCINCELCEKSCPNNHPVVKSMPIKSFVGHAVNIDEQLSSTSGGIATVISRWCIRNGGVVYGCSAKDCTHVQHTRVVDEDELIFLKGSKYVQSDMNTIYSQVRKDLCDNKIVVFIGTPCQCAGLRCFLKKVYEKLYLVDFVCHGVPSQKILNEELKLHANEEQLRTSRLSFRRKVPNGKGYKTQYGIFLKDANGCYLCEEVFPINLYITGFLNALFYRKSCYQCRYTTPERVSDITLGDFGDHDDEYTTMEGHSRLLSMTTVNTDKGKMILESIDRCVNLSTVDYKNLVTAQGQLRNPMKWHRYRDELENSNYIEVYSQKTSSMLKEDVARIKKKMRVSYIRNRISSSLLVKTIYNKLKHK